MLSSTVMLSLRDQNFIVKSFRRELSALYREYRRSGAISDPKWRYSIAQKLDCLHQEMERFSQHNSYFDDENRLVAYCRMALQFKTRIIAGRYAPPPANNNHALALSSLSSFYL